MNTNFAKILNLGKVYISHPLLILPNCSTLFLNVSTG